jgi:signal transduction histidine kinase
MKIVHMHESILRKPTSDELAGLCQISKFESIGAAATGIAHDFNNLLTPVVLAMDEMQRSSQLSVWLSGKLEHALACVERAQRLVQRLLTFSRMKPATREAVNVVEMLLGMKEIFTSFLSSSILLELDFPADLPPAMIDRDQIETALLNLIINARDAMPAGGKIILSIALETFMSPERLSSQERQMLRLSVSDTGLGMNRETQERAVDPFFSTKEIGKGTGLGLPLVCATVKQLGGHFFITSEIGFGTCVDLWLPLTEGHDLEVGRSYLYHN